MYLEAPSVAPSVIAPTYLPRRGSVVPYTEDVPLHVAGRPRPVTRTRGQDVGFKRSKKNTQVEARVSPSKVFDSVKGNEANVLTLPEAVFGDPLK